MKKKAMHNIETAVVQLRGSKSRGVLVPGNLIITAAHCVTVDLANINLNDGPIEHIISANGEELSVQGIAVEPINDIAVLGSVDEQEATEEAEKFEAFCRKTRPVKICLSDFEVLEPFPVHLLNADGTWVWGKATKTNGDAQVFALELDKPVQAGASGGPIVNDYGELVGVVVRSSATIDENGNAKDVRGWTPYPPLTLPPWVCRRIFRRNLAAWSRILKARRPVAA